MYVVFSHILRRVFGKLPVILFVVRECVFHPDDITFLERTLENRISHHAGFDLFFIPDPTVKDWDCFEAKEFGKFLRVLPGEAVILIVINAVDEKIRWQILVEDGVHGVKVFAAYSPILWDFVPNSTVKLLNPSPGRVMLRVGGPGVDVISVKTRRLTV